MSIRTLARRALSAAALLSVPLVSSPVLAQGLGGVQTRVVTTLTGWQTLLIAAGLFVIVLAVIFVGLALAFRSRGMEGLWGVVFGAFIAGNAVTIGTALYAAA